MEVPVATDTTQLFQRSGYTTPPLWLSNLGTRVRIPYRGKNIQYVIEEGVKFGEKKVVEDTANSIKLFTQIAAKYKSPQHSCGAKKLPQYIGTPSIDPFLLSLKVQLKLLLKILDKKFQIEPLYI
jgi:hypothetical protein